MSEEGQNELSETRTILFTTILTGDDAANLETTLNAVGESLGKAGLEVLLLLKRLFVPLGDAHDPLLLDALRLLLKDQLPSLEFHHFQDPKSMLYVHLKAYRGLPIHLVAALGRHRIMRMLMNMLEKYDLDCLELLRATDSCGNTALSLAVEHDRGDTVWHITGELTACPANFAQDVLRHAIAKVTNRVRFPNEPLFLTVEQLLGEVFLMNRTWGVEKAMSLLHYITDYKLMNIDDAFNYSNKHCSFVEPNPFHYAVFRYATRVLGPNDTYILYLLGEKNGTRPDDISRMKLGPTTVLNGTVAHFALGGYTQANLQQIHPGTWEGKKLRKSSVNEGPEEGQNATFVEMLKYVRDVYMVDLSKPNHDHKTPLDCLPPDADPSLIQVLMDYD